MPRGHLYQFFCTRDEIKLVLGDSGFDLEIVAVDSPNIFTYHTEVPTIENNNRWRLMVRCKTDHSEASVIAQARDETRFTGFLIVDLPKIFERDAVLGALLYDDSLLRNGYPEASAIFRIYRSKIEKLTRGRRVQYAESRKLATVRYSPAIEELVHKRELCLRLPYGDPKFQKRPPFVIAN